MMVEDPRRRISVAMTPEEVLGPLNEFERKYAPESLFLAGDFDVLKKGARVSIIGSRKASPSGLKLAKELAEKLVEDGVVVVSGLAEGIDTAAHEGAIQAGGRTIAVLGTPLDDCFPKQNRRLQERIMQDHLVISQFPSGYKAYPGNFPMRNRTMALVADATVIMEAGEKSGTMHQGWEAIRLSRPLFLEKQLFEKPLKWVQDMQRYGAQPFTIEDLGILLEILPPRGCCVAGPAL
jgi:DNA processing protein